MRLVANLILISIFFSLSGCGNSPHDDSDKGLVALGDCKMFFSGNDYFNSLSSEHLGNGRYNINFSSNVDGFSENSFSFSEGCSVEKYETAIAKGFEGIIFEDDSDVTYFRQWAELDLSAQEYLNLFLGHSETYSLCIRATANSGDVSHGYCKSFTTAAEEENQPTPPVDNTPPSGVKNLSLTFNKTTNKITVSWTAASDTESSIKEYIVNLVDTDLAPVTTSTKYAPKSSYFETISVDSLPRGASYLFSIVAVNSKGLVGEIKTASFTIPKLLEVKLLWTTVRRGTCFIGPSFKSCSATKEVFEDEISTFLSEKYPECNVSTPNSDSVEIDCKSNQACNTVHVPGLCGGVQTQFPIGQCGEVHGVTSIDFFTCSSWSP